MASRYKPCNTGNTSYLQLMDMYDLWVKENQTKMQKQWYSSCYKLWVNISYMYMYNNLDKILDLLYNDGLTRILS